MRRLSRAMTTYHKYFLSMMLALSVSFVYAQQKDSVVKSIRILYKKINTDSTLKTVKLENEQFLRQITDGGGSLTGFFKDDKIWKVHVWVGLSFAVRQFDYYFNDKEQLFFVYETEEDYPYDTNSGRLNYTKLVPAFEARYYFDAGKIIAVKNKGKRRFTPPSDFINNMVVDGKSYTALLKLHLKKTNLQSPTSNH